MACACAARRRPTGHPSARTPAHHEPLHLVVVLAHPDVPACLRSLGATRSPLVSVTLAPVAPTGGSEPSRAACGAHTEGPAGDGVPGTRALGVVLVSCGAAPVNGDLVTSLAEGNPGAPVLVLSERDDEDDLLAALRAGATGYLSSATTAGELAAAVRRAMSGSLVVDMALGGRLAGRLARSQVTSAGDRFVLRARERQVLEALVRGQRNREIAADLHLGEETVKTYLRSLYRKLGARDRADAVAIALSPEGARSGLPPRRQV